MAIHQVVQGFDDLKVKWCDHHGIFMLNTKITLQNSSIECLDGIIDVIGGWTTEGVGHTHGKGNSLAVMHMWMEKLQAQFLE